MAFLELKDVSKGYDGANGTRSEWIRDVPENVARATIAAEDRRFERHPGVDPIAVARAALHDAWRLRAVEGYQFAISLYALLGLKDRVRTAAATAPELLEGLLELPSAEPRRYLYDLAADYPRRGGRAFRPSLCIATARAFGAPMELALRSAVSLEMIHNAMISNCR